MAGLAGYNPFTDRNIIKNPNEFFGRKDELRTIFTRLQGLQSTSVYGKSKIGKSTLLYHVFTKIPEELGDEYKSTYIDLRSSKYNTVDDFLRNVLFNMGCDPKVIQFNTSTQNLAVFEETIENLRKECKPILIIDNFDYIIKNVEFDERFLETLRTLGQQGNVAYVIASLNSLNLLYRRTKLCSPLHSILYEIQLEEFTQTEITDFLSARREGVCFDSKEIELIKETAGKNPLYLRIACDHIFAYKSKKWNRNKLKREIETDIKHYNGEKEQIEHDIRIFIKKITKSVQTFPIEILFKILNKSH